MEYPSIFYDFTGFTNQMLLLSFGILNASKTRKNVVVVDKFLNTIHTKSYSNISKILNLEETNKFLKQKYNLIIADRENLKFELLQVLYGIPESSVDITNEVKRYFLKNNKLHITKGTNFNKLKRLPFTNVKKMILVKYKVNGYYFEKVYPDSIYYDVIMNEDGPYKYFLEQPIGTTEYCNNVCDQILKNMVYSNEIINKANMVSSTIDTTKRINVIHLRVEKDATSHWSKLNNMPEPVFRQKLEQTYIRLIKEHINPEDLTILLASSYSNEVVTFLKNNGYSYTFVNKFFVGREVNAIVDLLVSKNCNNVFIGATQSTFTMYIKNIIPQCNTRISINMDNINEMPMMTSGP